jgi:hypothetical protein
MAEPVLARLASACEHPCRASAVTPPRMALVDGVGGASLRSKPRGVRIGCLCRDGGHREAVSDLQRSVWHGQHAEGALLAGAFWAVPPPSWRRAIAPRPQGVSRLCLLLRGVPERAIHPRCAFAWLCGHSLHGECSAAQRMGQATVHGVYLAPSPGLTRLDDTPLEPTHVLMTWRPLDGRLVHHSAGSRPSSHSCRHRLGLLSQFAPCSRNERPDGRQPACAGGSVAVGSPSLPAITARPLLLPSSSTRRPIGAPYGWLSRRGRAPGFPRSAAVPSDGLGAVCPPVGWVSAIGETGSSYAPHRLCGSSLSASLACWFSRR